MARPRKSPSKLPQHQETWYLAVRELRLWITPPDEEPYRPYGALVVNLDQGLVQGLSTFPSPPTPDQVIEKLFEAMMSQPPGTGQEPHRPKQVHFEDQNLMRSLASALEDVGVSAVFQPAEEIADEILSEMEAHLAGERPSISGLLDQKGVAPKQIEALFEAAAQYYRAAPWVHLTNMQPLAIQVEPESKARYVVVMGSGGIEYGIALYKQWDDFLMRFDPADRLEDVIPPDGANSLFFGDATQVPFDDLDAIAEHGWEVVDADGYPIPIVFTRDGEAMRPGSADLRWYEAALRAIIKFVPTQLKPDDQGDYHPAKVELTVPTHLGDKKVTIEYPAGDVPLEDQPVAGFDWDELEEDGGDFDIPGGFDRRAMEGSLAAFGGGFDDPEDKQAQKIMYAAWDEQNPAKRITLAHQALAISPNCADAYVLLAEEEADSIGRALEYYQKGVEAGEKALGKAFFAEHEGYFWGMLETRPYMRARAGLASVLWNLGRKQEAQAHYQEMLRLNPNDNQGIRYTLLVLLLDLNRMDEVDALLGEYEGDWSSEWSYTRVLRAFQKEGDSQAAQEALKGALEQNPYVPDYLTGAKRLPQRAPDYISHGGESEAVSYASASLNIWRRTPGAVPWLREQTQPPARKRKEKPKKKTRRGSRGRKK
jgi:tetratricopeptide (TPR) repeat protein